MKIYNVIFCYAIQVEAIDEKEAEEQATKLYHNINPKIEEMNIEIKEEK